MRDENQFQFLMLDCAWTTKWYVVKWLYKYLVHWEICCIINPSILLVWFDTLYMWSINICLARYKHWWNLNLNQIFNLLRNRHDGVSKMVIHDQIHYFTYIVMSPDFLIRSILMTHNGHHPCLLTVPWLGISRYLWKKTI